MSSVIFEISAIFVLPLGTRPTQPKAAQRKDGSWLLDGMISIYEFKELFKLENLPGENRETFQTLGGFLFTQMKRVPVVSEAFDWQSLHFEIVDMDAKRIERVLVSRRELGNPSAAPTV